MRWKEREIQINKGDIGALSKRLYDAIPGIQTGQLPDKYGWTVEV
jgi:branched-chain amino acid aminotransferase